MTATGSPEQITFLEQTLATLKAAEDLKKVNEGNRLVRFRPYQRQLEFFELGASRRERMFNAGNQLGKSDAGAYETAVHLTGRYPDWWKGWRFDQPTLCWAAGITSVKTMDINQRKLCGPPNLAGSLGTGLIPRDCFIGDPVLGRGTTGAFASVNIRHVSGGVSTLAFKAYEQGWQKMQGDGVNFIWLDEEPDDFKVYTECQARLIATRGRLIITFTPLNGETELFQSFSTGGDQDKGFVNMTGEDVLNEPHGHLDRETYDRQIAAFPLHEREARKSGRPVMGSGVVFPIPRETIECPTITEPLGHWRLGWGVDFGGMGGSSRKFSHPFAAVLGFYDPITDIITIAHALQLKNMMPVQHAAAMKVICAGAPVFWPHDGHRRTADDSPETTTSLYKSHGLRMYATHATFKHGGYATETGIMEMYQRFTSGRLKVATHLADWWEEFIAYHRDETGELVKVHDDLMSATRILTMMLPRFGVGGVPMGNMGGRHWKDYQRGVSENGGVQMARGLDYDLFNPTG